MTKNLIKISLFSLVVLVVFSFVVNTAYALDSNCNGLDDDSPPDGQCDEDFIANTECDGADTDSCREGKYQCPKACGVAGVYCDDYTDSTVENCYDCNIDSDCDGSSDYGDSDCNSVDYCSEYADTHADVDSASCVAFRSDDYGSSCLGGNVVTKSAVSGTCTCDANPVCLAQKTTYCAFGCEGSWPNAKCKSGAPPDTLPTCPISYTPTINSVNQPLDQDISWSGASAESYDVYFGTSSPGTFIKNQTTTSYDPGALVVNTKYYWKVQVKKGVDTVDCAVQNFTTTASSPSPIVSGVYWQFSTQDAAEPSFTITAQSPIYTVATNEPNSTKSLITLTSLDGFTDKITLSFSADNNCVNQPSTIFDPSEVLINPGDKQTNYSSFWIKTTNCTAGTIKITITGTPTKDPAKFKAVDLSLGIVTPLAPIVEETTRAPFWRQIIPW